MVVVTFCSSLCPFLREIIYIAEPAIWVAMAFGRGWGHGSRPQQLACYLSRVVVAKRSAGHESSEFWLPGNGNRPLHGTKTGNET